MNVSSNTVESSSQTLSRGPDFLCVGPEKTGTTWLFDHLMAHDSIAMPKLKEIKYFYEDYYAHMEKPIPRLFNRDGWHRWRYRRLVKETLKELVTHPIRLFKNREDLKWNISYVFQTHDDDWYLSKFPKSSDVLQGDISPQYFFLPEEQIKKIQSLIPNTKVIVTLRDPVEWMRSYGNMVTRNGYLKSEYNNDMKEFIRRTFERSSFSATYNSWLKYFSKDQVEIFYYDGLLEDPWAHYVNICNFLEIEPDENRRDSLGKRVNFGTKNYFDEAYVKEIRELWRDDILELSKMRGDVPEKWLDYYR